MSALWAPSGGWTEAAEQPRTQLRAVDQAAPRLARFPFLLVLIGVFGLGMAGLLMLNTTLQNQAFQARTLNREATQLAYVQADLENRLDAQAAPAELARRASALGMRPNPHPAFLVLPKGKVIGKAVPVTGAEVPSLIVKTPAEIKAERAAEAGEEEGRGRREDRQGKGGQEPRPPPRRRRRRSRAPRRRRRPRRRPPPRRPKKKATGRGAV